MEGRFLRVNKWNMFSGNRYSRYYGFFYSSKMLHPDSASLSSSSVLEFAIGGLSSMVPQEIDFLPILKRQFGLKYYAKTPLSLAWRKISFILKSIGLASTLLLQCMDWLFIITWLSYFSHCKQKDQTKPKQNTLWLNFTTFQFWETINLCKYSQLCII